MAPTRAEKRRWRRRVSRARCTHNTRRAILITDDGVDLLFLWADGTPEDRLAAPWLRGVS